MIKQIESSAQTGFFTSVEPTANVSPYTLWVDPHLQYQEVVGFGGAFTEAAAFNFSKLSDDSKAKILALYFDPSKGLGYRLGRVAINSCDFALGNYDYVDTNDTTLDSFDIAREHQWVIPMIQQAQAVAKQPLSILASPWSPPAWMKTTNQMNHGGSLKPEYYPVWAKYFIKFIEAMKKAGVHVDAVSVQNEPQAVQTWDSCIYTIEEEAEFALNHLGPMIKQSDYPNTKIYIWDHNRDIIFERVQPILSDPRAKDLIHGVAFHWYVSEEFSNLSKVKTEFPETHLLFTEGCIEGGTVPGIFTSGERYMRNMIGDFSNGCEGYIDWNLVLDMQGGPNHVGNYCDAPILCDPDQDTFHVNSSYYAIGHFSKYVQPGAVSISSKTDHPFVTQVAFQNPDQSVVVILQNETNDATSLSINLNNQMKTISLQPHSFSTFIWES